jgi:hypothetical protein
MARGVVVNGLRMVVSSLLKCLEGIVGLYIHSIGELPGEAYRSYYVYLLDYGWDEAFGEAVRKNLPRMADRASRSDAVVIHGPRGMHFEDEVLSWHHINGGPAEDVLPAILVTTRHPRTFREVYGPGATFRAPSDALLLIPLRKTCKTPDDVVVLIDGLFRDVAGKKNLSDFAVAKELRRGVGPAIVDALVVQPKVAGVGIDLAKLARFFKGGRYR